MFFSVAMGGMLVMPFLLLGLLKIPVAVMVAMAIPIGLIVMAILVRFLPPFLLAPFGIVADEGVMESLERSNKIYLKNFAVYLQTLLMLMLLMPFVIIFSLGILSPVPLFFLAAMFKLGQRTAKAI
ncbi:MAG: hypothetical protein SGI77_07320 [Pirellulaceae bacterium]|nr:hypothetical protein [Pirellulaceae bacterium]